MAEAAVSLSTLLHGDEAWVQVVPPSIKLTPSLSHTFVLPSVSLGKGTTAGVGTWQSSKATATAQLTEWSGRNAGKAAPRFVLNAMGFAISTGEKRRGSAAGGEYHIFSIVQHEVPLGADGGEKSVVWLRGFECTTSGDVRNRRAVGAAPLPLVKTTLANIEATPSVLSFDLVEKVRPLNEAEQAALIAHLSKQVCGEYLVPASVWEGDRIANMKAHFKKFEDAAPNEDKALTELYVRVMKQAYPKSKGSHGAAQKFDEFVKALPTAAALLTNIVKSGKLEVELADDR
jgi:hypothetical protein